MKKLRIKIIIILLAFYVSSIPFRNFFTERMLQGVYINTNYQESKITPNYPDTLYLLENKKMKSSHFGNGEYEVKFSFFKTEITLWYEGRREYFKTYITRSWLGQVKIFISSDYSHYYLKE